MMEKRNSERGSAQLHLFDLPPAPGVGGRQKEASPSAAGGGYLETCTPPKFSAPEQEKKSAPRDPRLDELRRMGLQRVWLEVAEEIGVDAFMAMWRILDRDPACHHSDGYLKITLKKYRAYLRFLRNRMIETLAGMGFSNTTIIQRIKEQLGEEVSLRHLQRIAQDK